MTVLIQNTTNEVRYVYRFNGTKLHILPNDFITFEVDDITETDFWNNNSLNYSSKCKGIVVVVDPNRIKILKKLKACGKYNHQKDNTVKTENKTVTNKVENSTKTIINTINNISDNHIDTVKSNVTVNEESVNFNLGSINEVDIESFGDNSESKEITESNEVTKDIVKEDYAESNETELTDKFTTHEYIDNIEDIEDIEDINNIFDSTSIIDDTNNIEQSNNTAYTNESLSKLTKTELQEILDSMSISYKKNNSVSTLISLILNNCNGGD